MLIGTLDPHLDELSRPELLSIDDMQQAVDLGRVGGRARDGAVLAGVVDERFHRRADLALQARGADLRLLRHETLQTLLLDLFGHRAGQIVRSGAIDR